MSKGKIQFLFQSPKQINQWKKEGKDEVKNEIPVQSLP